MFAYVNILSFEGQFPAIDPANTALKQFASLLISIRNHDRRIRIFRDSYIHNRQIENGIPFAASFNRLSRDTQNAIRQLIDRHLPDWRIAPLHANTSIYSLPEINNLSVTDTCIAEAACRKHQSPNTECALVNISPSTYCNLEILNVANSDTGTIFLKCISSFAHIQTVFASTSPTEYLLSLFPNRFTRTGRASVQGTIILREEITGYFWYYDNFHRDHFEVFNDMGNHLGIADLDGALDRTERDVTKSLNI